MRSEGIAEAAIDFVRVKAMDHSAVEAIGSLAERYRKAGKRLHLRHLSPDCLELLTKARERVDRRARRSALPHCG